MRRVPLFVPFLCGLFLIGPGAALAQSPAPGGDPSARCALRVYYADKRPYESPNSDPFYAVNIGQDLGVQGNYHRFHPRFHAAAHLVVRTNSGLFEKVIGRSGGSEFTLPSHESVVAAWVDGVGGPDGSLQRCDPSGAFFVDGFHGVAFTKLYRLEEKGGRSIVSGATHLPLIPVLPLIPLSTLRDPGRRPAGELVALPSPCTEPDRDAMPAAPVLVPFGPQMPGAKRPSVVVDVSPFGTVMSVDIGISSGSRKADDAMIAAALGSTFTPARWRCTNVPDRLSMPDTFDRPEPVSSPRP